MDTILLIARLLLGLVLLVAGLAKLADREGSSEAVRAFGVPETLNGTVVALLPLGELAAAILLVPSGTARAGAALAAVLLLSFCVGITRSMIRGEAPDCHCFGQLHSSPAGPKTLARNLFLTAVAGLVLAGGAGTSATAWIGHLSGTALVALIAGIVLAGILAASGAFTLSLLRRHGHMLLRIDALEQALAERGIEVPSVAPMPLPAPAGLPIGTAAPEFELRDVAHRSVSLDSLIAPARPLILVFTDPGCGPCSALLPQVAAWQREHSDALRIALVSRGGRDANFAHAREHGLEDVLVQRDSEVSELYRVNGTPSAVLVAPDGAIASPAHAGAEAISALVSSRVAAPTLAVHQHVPQLGRPAPNGTLLTLDGDERALSSMLSGSTAVLFWNPSCGFCERMLPDLRRVAETPDDNTPSLLLVSTGDPETNRKMGLNAPILLDQSFATGTAFGAAGTPSAVLVDGDGRIASRLAVGADEVMALIDSSPARVG
jgi:protein-disulfide isomerase